MLSVKIYPSALWPRGLRLRPCAALCRSHSRPAGVTRPWLIKMSSSPEGATSTVWGCAALLVKRSCRTISTGSRPARKASRTAASILSLAVLFLNAQALRGHRDAPCNNLSQLGLNLVATWSQLGLNLVSTSQIALNLLSTCSQLARNMYRPLSGIGFTGIALYCSLQGSQEQVLKLRVSAPT